MIPPRLRRVTVLPPTRLKIEYLDGQVRLFDVEPYLDKGLFRELRNPGLFASARVDLDTVAWSNGADIDPECLYADSVPIPGDAGA